MRVIESGLEGVLVLEPKKFGDSRGFFLETFRLDLLRELGIRDDFVQDNHSRSVKGVLRGLHYQLQQPQGKLVRVASGAVFDVAVDVRRGSPGFGKWFGSVLDEESMRMMYIPPGFAHGFLVLSDTADFIYKCTNYYHPQSEQGILWSDPELGIQWPLEMDFNLSEKDSILPTLSQQSVDLLPEFKRSI
jgi:dTDP-4-dehydrorhamnose 3,5-epimerase